MSSPVKRARDGKGTRIRTGTDGLKGRQTDRYPMPSLRWSADSVTIRVVLVTSEDATLWSAREMVPGG